MNEDHIFPECPNCDNKASRGNGVTISQVAHPPWEWTCPECQTIHKGTFVPNSTEVVWHDHRPTLRRKVTETFTSVLD